MMTLILATGTGAAGSTGSEGLLIWAAVLLGVCIVLLFAELLVPSGGLIGVLAGIAAVGSVIAFWRYDASYGVIALITYMVLGPIALLAMFKWWINSPLGRLMILEASVTEQRPTKDDEGEGEGDGDGGMAAEFARRERLAQLHELIGAEGKTVTALRPVGVVKIGGERVDALAETGVIEAGVQIEVTDVYDNQVKVRPKKH